MKETQMIKAPPPQLHFDDGSRIIKENASSIKQGDPQETASASSNDLLNPRGLTPIDVYYEIGRVANEIVDEVLASTDNDESDVSTAPQQKIPSDGFLCKVALQFPDELLNDSAQVSWLMEEAIEAVANEKLRGDDNHYLPPLVFILGDTTYSSCSPDEIGAQHLDADVIVHYGQYASLSPTQCLPVFYSFGVFEWTGLEECITTVTKAINDSEEKDKSILLVCERRYHRYMKEISESLAVNRKVKEVIFGAIPKQNRKWMKATNSKNVSGHVDANNGIYLGGLFIPISPSSMSNYTLLYIGDDSGESKSRQFLNTVLRCSSPTSGTKECWSYNPETKVISTDPYSMLGVSRYLNRRFFLTQKAQLASIIGILVGTLSQDRFRTMIETVRRKIQDSGRGCYTFVVGKINVAKLANFAEVECFVLISCEETSVLQDERDFHVPVITPTELEIVLGEKVWNGSDSCNADFNEYLWDNDNVNEESEMRGEGDDQEKIIKGIEDLNDSGSEEDTSDDEPFFSMITGTYVSKPNTKRKQQKSNNEESKGGIAGSQIIEYRSEAAEFLKKRDYKGLQAKIGQTEVRAAIEGQTGIASDYGK